jgi:hypothetical protein
LFVWLVGFSAYFFAAAVFRDYYYGSSTLDWLLPLAAVLAMTISTRWWVALLVTAIWVVPLWAYATNWVIQSASFVETVMALPWTAAVVLAWWIALATDGRRVTSPVVGVSLIVGATIAVPLLRASELGRWAHWSVLLVLVLGGLVISSVDPRVATTGAVYAGLFLPMAVMAVVRWDSWTVVIVLSVAVALTAAASQIGMTRLART